MTEGTGVEIEWGFLEWVSRSRSLQPACICLLIKWTMTNPHCLCIASYFCTHTHKDQQHSSDPKTDSKWTEMVTDDFQPNGIICKPSTFTLKLMHLEILWELKSVRCAAWLAACLSACLCGTVSELVSLSPLNKKCKSDDSVQQEKMERGDSAFSRKDDRAKMDKKKEDKWMSEKNDVSHNYLKNCYLMI